MMNVWLNERINQIGEGSWSIDLNVIGADAIKFVSFLEASAFIVKLEIALQEHANEYVHLEIRRVVVEGK